MRVLISALFFVQALQLSTAGLGFDGIGTLSTATFTCLKNAGYSYFISRVYRSVGKVDITGIQSIITARNAGFTDVDGYLFPCLSSTCPSAATQVTDTYNALKAQGATIGRIWLDVEIFAWPASLTSNQQFITDMANTAKNLGLQVGIYSNPTNWEKIVGLSWNGVSQYPLWWARYNNKQDLTTNWSNFGGWSAPMIHQFTGDSKDCGISLDKNWK